MDGIDVEEGQPGQDDAALTHQAAQRDHPGVGHLVAMRVSRQLGNAGRAAGVEERREVARLRRRAQETVGRLTCGRDGEVGHLHSVHGLQGHGVDAGGAEREERGQAGLLGQGPRPLPHLGRQVRPRGHQHPRPRPGDQLAEMLGGQGAVHRGRDPRELGGQGGGLDPGGPDLAGALDPLPGAVG